ncbi:hypothetical protein C8R43DRAFT_963921 [Mycena crocata]|nr:hypothetical protein C8R43DRAFT_963921 [Mycena crocata]
MKRSAALRKNHSKPSTSLLATSVPTTKINFHTDASPHKGEQRYIGNTTNRATKALPQLIFDNNPASTPDDSPLPFLGTTSVFDDPPGPLPAYETTAPCDEKGGKKSKRQNEISDFQAQERIFLDCLLSRYHHPSLLTPCACGDPTRLRKVACNDCLQPELSCAQCWLSKHRTMPTHWAFIWNSEEQFFEKTDFCRVLKNSVVALGHHGKRCPNAVLGRSFTLVDSNGIHATAISFCRCKLPNGERGDPEFEQLLRAGIFPGSLKEPKTGYTLSLLEFYRQLRNQGKGSAYGFVNVLQRMADPFFAGSVPNIYANFLAVTRFHHHLDIVMQRGHAHGINVPLTGEAERPYPNRPADYLGLQCAACPERGVNMPLLIKCPSHLRHLIAQFNTLDGNFKANLFFKRDDGSDTCLTDGRMYFPRQSEFAALVKEFVVTDADKEVPCKAHIGSIRHQGQIKYGNTAVSGVVASACDHAVVGSFADMLRGEAFGIGTIAQHEHLKHTNTPPHPPASASHTVWSYDSYCSFVVNMVKRAMEIYPEETWLHAALAAAEGQIPADHINGHGLDCQAIWQAVYFACRAHFHGETAEMIWAFLNALGSSTRQMTGPARHDTMNFVIDAWNTWKVLGQAELLAEERLDALRLFELHMAVVEDLSRQHPTHVAAWSRLSRETTKSMRGAPQSVYQHQSTGVLTIENVLASLISEEHKRLTRKEDETPTTSLARWIHNGMDIERQELLIVALLKFHKEHPMEETWASITKLRATLSTDIKKFRERQASVYPRLKLSALDVDEPELTAVQLPSYRMKHGQRVGRDTEDAELQATEIKLRCGQANSGILAVRDASLALSAVRKAKDLDYRGQAGITCSQRNLQKAELMKVLEITVYNKARDALIHLGHMTEDAVEPFPPLTLRDTRRKETHLHRAKGDSRLFDGTAWYLQSGVTISHAAVASTWDAGKALGDSDSDEPQLLAGTQTLKRSGFKKSQRTPKRLKDIAPDDVVVESSASEVEDSDVERAAKQGGKRGQGKRDKKGKGKKKADGWIWLESMTKGQNLGEAKLAAYKEESDRVQWFRAEAEMYRWLEQYERKHAELMRVIERFRRDGVVWVGLADREEERNGGRNGQVNFARMQAAMYRRLQHNADVIFKSAKSGAHHDWVSATSLDELITKVDRWRDEVFKWMDEMGGTELKISSLYFTGIRCESSGTLASGGKISEKKPSICHQNGAQNGYRPGFIPRSRDIDTYSNRRRGRAGHLVILQVQRGMGLWL